MARPVMDRHLSDGELVRHLDGEGSEAEHAARTAHLSACAACAADLGTLEAEAERVQTWLLRAHPAPAAERFVVGRARAAPAWLKAAAAILLIAAPVVAIPGLRGWVVDRVVAPTATWVGATRGQAEPAALAVLRFKPDPGPFTVIVDRAQVGGSLALSRSPTPAGGNEAAGAAGTTGDAVLRAPSTVETVVSSTGVQLRNGVGDGGSYSLALPATVTRVRVRVGDREVVVGSDELDRGRVLPLDR